jgi:hypothetical protein
MNKKQIARHMVTIGIFTLVTSFIMVSLQSYRKLTEEKAQVGQGLKLEPIDPNIQMEILDEIESRKEYGLDEIKVISTPTPLPTTLPLSEDQIPTATPGGELTNE